MKLGQLIILPDQSRIINLIFHNLILILLHLFILLLLLLNLLPQKRLLPQNLLPLQLYPNLLLIHKDKLPSGQTLQSVLP